MLTDVEVIEATRELFLDKTIGRRINFIDFEPVRNGFYQCIRLERYRSIDDIKSLWLDPATQALVRQVIEAENWVCIDVCMKIMYDHFTIYIRRGVA